MKVAITKVEAAAELLSSLPTLACRSAMSQFSKDFENGMAW